MADDTSERNGQTTDAAVEIRRLSLLNEQLQRDCAELRKKLGEAEALRDGYLKAIYEYARMAGIGKEFENMDISDFEAVSAGPVETI